MNMVGRIMQVHAQPLRLNSVAVKGRDKGENRLGAVQEKGRSACRGTV